MWIRIWIPYINISSDCKLYEIIFKNQINIPDRQKWESMEDQRICRIQKYCFSKVGSSSHLYCVWNSSFKWIHIFCRFYFLCVPTLWDVSYTEVTFYDDVLCHSVCNVSSWLLMMTISFLSVLFFSLLLLLARIKWRRITRRRHYCLDINYQ